VTRRCKSPDQKHNNCTQHKLVPFTPELLL
jgi:hypothetical protein